MEQVLAIKIGMTQGWTTTGRRLPLTTLKIEPTIIAKIDLENDRMLVATGDRKASRVKKPLEGLMTKLGIKMSPKGVKELKFVLPHKQVGDTIKPSEVLAIGDLVTVQGVARGLGFAGVVKRHGFAGGPRTHGQSDRERAPGAIGQRTTPGRVFRGMRMAGRAGGQTVSILNLPIMSVNDETGEIVVAGVVPGAKQSRVMIKKTGSQKKYEELRA